MNFEKRHANLDIQHHLRVEKNVKNIERRIKNLIKKIVSTPLLKEVEVGEDIFSFKDYPALEKQADNIFKAFADDLNNFLVDTSTQEWKHAEVMQSSIFDEVATRKHYPPSVVDAYKQHRSDALKTFINRRQDGLTLSERVWNLTENTKAEIELALDIGIREGYSAQRLAQKLVQFLKNPDMLLQKATENHNPQKVSVRKPAGRGVYRSAEKNAIRLARTENNIAYHTANFLKYQEFDFVIGVEIKLSNNPNHCPFCSQMAGKYPKDFKFTGWHPQCRCSTMPILKEWEEMESAEPFANEVKEPPQAFSDWINANKEKINKAKSLPYFIKDNPQYTIKADKKQIQKETKINKLDTPEKVKLEVYQQEYLNELMMDIRYKAKIEHLSVQQLERKLTEAEIVQKVGGLDKTTGSCASLCLAYAGSKFGYDVTDFRGGNSMDFFSKKISHILYYMNADIEKNINDFIAARNLMNRAEANKEYIILTGRHASVVKKDNNGKWFYLELQDTPKKNGYQPLDISNDKMLKKRFACTSLNKNNNGDACESYSLLMEVDKLNFEEFKDLLGYINTAPNKQMKGRGGSIK